MKSVRTPGVIAVKITVLICILFSSIIFAQADRVLPFINTPTSAEINGMGYTSVANITDNPTALTSNPAHLGIQCLYNSNFNFNENYSNWVPMNNSNTWVLTIIARKGLYLDKIFPFLPSLCLGISYSNVYMHESIFIPEREGPDPAYTAIASEESNQFTLSLAMDYLVRASIGLTYKHVNSDLGNQPTASEQYYGSAAVDLYDVGCLFEIPVINLVSKITSKPITIYDNITPLFNSSLGISKSNLGQNHIFYEDQVQGYLLPRFARAGMGFTFGFQYDKDDISLIPFSLKWTDEANDLCVMTNSSGNSIYQPGLGDIDFFKEVILGKSKKGTDQLKGWELNFCESLYIYGGRFIDDSNLDYHNFTTNGFAVSSSGLFKTLALINPDMFQSEFMKYFLNNIVLKFNQSKGINFNTFSDNTKFYSLSISFKNL